VLSTPWGNQSEWAQHPLLVQLHREAWGGEKFFDMLERISQDPARYIDLMELQYLCIAFGFAGKYQVQERGHEHLLEVQQDLYRKIRNQRGPSEAGLSLRWRGLEDRRNPLIRYLPWWVAAAAALPILAITFTAYYASLAGAAAPVHAELAKVGLEDFSPAPQAAPVRGPTLKQLLASDERSGALTVEEQGNRTVVTLLARDLFPSGSAAVNPAYDDTIQRLTSALNKVPGRVLVVGHTDDQPIKSLRFQDNFELSRERAVSVVTLLQKGIDNTARLQWNGVGSSEPRYRPESDPANRSRNRRVEIIHVRGT
jgi:type VI secretion system protein ImpK